MNSKKIESVAVDLTPILPGGENGGAKIFVLELIRILAAMEPETRFTILTQSQSHEELSCLDAPNVTRRIVVRSQAQETMRSGLDNLARVLLPHLPRRIRGMASSFGYRINSLIKKGGSSTLLGDMGVDLLFCPLTAPTYAEPGIPTVCTIYDLQYRTYPEFFAPEDVARRERTFLEAARHATRLAAISDYSRDTAIRIGDLDPHRIATIYLRMAQRFDQNEDNAVLDRLGLTGRRYLIYPANFWRHKNHEALLAAFGIACHDGLPGDVQLVCTGAPSERQQWLIHAADAMDLGERVLFPGFLPNDELAALLTNSMGMIFPSLYEGFGLPVVEAMAAGVPVGCSNTTSLPEVAGEAALLFDPRIPTQIAETIRQLAEDEVTRQRLVDAGKRRAEEFADSMRMAREYWELFSSATEQPVHVAQLSGIYPDGWCAGSLVLHLPAAEGARALILDLVVPAWLKPEKIRIKAARNNASRVDVVQLLRGDQREVSISLGPDTTKLLLNVSPTFVPSKEGLGEDSRELSIMVESAMLRHESGRLDTLYPEEQVSIVCEGETCPERTANSL